MTNPITPNDIRKFITDVDDTINLAGLASTEVVVMLTDALEHLEGAAHEIDRLNDIIQQLGGQVKDLQGLKARIDSLKREVTRVDSIANRALDLNDKVIKENAELRKPADAPAATAASDEGGHQCATCGVRWDSRYDGKTCPRCGWQPGTPVNTASDWYVAPGTPLVLELTNGQKRPMKPASAAPDAAATAAQGATYPTLQEAIEASRKADVEAYAAQGFTAVVVSETMLTAKPAAKLPRLAPTHHDSLSRLAKGEVARRNWQRSTYYKWPGMDRLLKMGYASEVRSGDFYRATITDKGQAYLAVIAAQGEGRAK